MEHLFENLNRIKTSLSKGISLVAVSKTKTAEAIKVLYDAGHRSFGENKAQELCSKYEVLPKDIEWHFIGHLQTNKVKYIAPVVKLIHSVDSLKLLSEINRQAQKNSKTIDCLLQFYIASEETKFGLDLQEARDLLNSEEFKNMSHVRMCGVMGMASFTDDTNIIHAEFAHLRQIFSELKNTFFHSMDFFKEISMGMTDDYQIAIEEGSTIIRVGSAIFGERT